MDILSNSGKTAVFEGAVILRGSGRFEAATGGFAATINERMQPTNDPLVSVAKYGYDAQGAIRYFPSLAKDVGRKAD